MFKQRKGAYGAATLIIFFAFMLTLPPTTIYAKQSSEKDIVSDENLRATQLNGQQWLRKSPLKVENVKTEISIGTILSGKVQVSHEELLEALSEECQRIEEEKKEMARLEAERIEAEKLSTKMKKAGYKLQSYQPHPQQSERKPWMSYTTITAVSTPQYKLNNSIDAYTGNYGIRMIGDHYLVALGSGYADYIGQAFLITFEDGQQIKVMVGDFKADIHTDPSNRMALNNNDLIEFIVDVDAMHKHSPTSALNGSFHDRFQGKVTEIFKIIK